MKATILNMLSQQWNQNLKIIIKLAMSKTIEILGQVYDITDPRVVKDYYSEEYILRVDSVPIYGTVLIDRNGYQGATNDVPVHIRDVTARHRAGDFFKLRSRFGDVYIKRDYRVEGNGRLYPHPANPNILLDSAMVNNVLENKFRPFDNQAKPFTDVFNPLIPEEDQKALAKRNFSYGVWSPTYKMFEGLNYTFGVEIETSSGRLNEEDVEGLNLKCEFDGSLRETPDQRREDVLGGEYITGVLVGDAGMTQLQKICNKIAEKCTINEKCGVHVHVGGIHLNKENIVYLYKLGEMLQDEVFQMLPASRRKNAYCRKIDSLSLDMTSLNNVKTTLGHKILIDEYYNKIFKLVSHGKEADKHYNKRSNHPMGSKCGYDKATQRYCWLNFVTAMFNTKNNANAMTLEFRSHSATVNYKKIKNWVKICMAFVAFAENHKASIKRGYWLDANKNEYSITLATILKAVYPKTNKVLVNYVEERKSKFLLDKGDIEKQEYATDKDDIKFLTLKEDTACV